MARRDPHPKKPQIDEVLTTRPAGADSIRGRNARVQLSTPPQSIAKTLSHSSLLLVTIDPPAKAPTGDDVVAVA